VKTAVGDPASLIDWGGDHPLPGTVKNVEASAFTKISALGIEEQRVHVIVSIPNPPASLGDGYRVQGRVIIWSSSDAVQIPIGALTRFGSRWATFVVDGGRARARVLDIGHRNDEAAEALSGARAGDRVILHPSDAIANDVRVTD
jgi:HlyD family secretion protein